MYSDSGVLKEKLQSDLNKALKSRDTLTISTLRFVLAALHNKEIEKRASLSDDEVRKLLSIEVKKHQDSITQFRGAGRAELADKEQAELLIIRSYLPAEASAAEIEKLVDEAIAELKPEGASDFGKVMREVMAKAEGRAGGQSVSEMVKAKLNQQK